MTVALHIAVGVTHELGVQWHAQYELGMEQKYKTVELWKPSFLAAF